MSDEQPPPTSRGFRDLHAWQRGRTVCSSVYRLTQAFPDDERFGLTSQIRRSAISTPSNIAEGYGRQTPADYLRHLRIARGSLFELQTQLIVASDLGYVADVPETQDLKDELESLSQLLSGLIRSVQQRRDG
ncbi:MAG: four helix bundle protein [Planctomycetota bacterium]